MTRVIGEIQRYKAVIADSSNPAEALTIITNDPRAVPTFRHLLEDQRVNGYVIVRP